MGLDLSCPFFDSSSTTVRRPKEELWKKIAIAETENRVGIARYAAQHPLIREIRPDINSNTAK